MDSQKKNESRTRLREEALARRMGEALDRISAEHADECPDAELIAAYHERALQTEETAQWEGHFAGCSRCRKILAVLAASVDAPLAETEVARLGELVAAAAGPAGVATLRKAKQFVAKRFDWRARWLAPALGVAAVFAVWFALRAPWRTPDRGATPTLIAQAPRQEEFSIPESVNNLSKVAPEQNRKGKAAKVINRFAAKTPSLRPPLEAPAKSRTETGNPIATVPPSAGLGADSIKSPQEEKKSTGQMVAPEMPDPATSPPPPQAPQARVAQAMPAPVAQARAQGDQITPSAPEVSRGTTSSVTTAEVAPRLQPQSTQNLPSNGREYQNLDLIRPGSKYTSLLKTPSGSILWRAGKGGNIEQSTDDGKSWVSQESPSKEDWLAGLAVSETVCWLVGRNGAIARTVDGKRWARISSPSQGDVSGKLPDWNAVLAQDALSATIAAADGRRYITKDGGKTWQAQ